MLFFVLPQGKLSEMEKSYIERLYQTESKRMWYEAYKILQNKENANDVLQKTFLSLIDNVTRLMQMEESEVSAYVYVSTKNRALDFLRGSQKISNITSIEAFPAAEETENIVIQNFEWNRLRKIVAEINPIYGDAFYMRHFLNLDYKEIAEALSISVEVAWHRVSRAKKKIINLVRERGDEYD